MQRFKIPTISQVSEKNKEILKGIQKTMGFLPNFYAYLAKNETTLPVYRTLQKRKSTLSAKEREVVSLVVSQANDCSYCLSAHSLLGKINGFSEAQLLEIRKTETSSNKKYDVLAKFTKSIVDNRGKASDQALENFFAVGYTESNMIDIVMIIGEVTISNYIHNLIKYEIDFPLAPEIDLQTTY